MSAAWSTRTDVDDVVRARLVAAVRRFTPAWMADQVDDLVQMAIMKILRGSPDWTLEEPLLRRIAYSVVIDELRRRKRRAETGISPSLPERIANSAEITPDQRLDGTRIGEVVVGCLQDLSEDRRRAVTLYLQDHTVPQIAELLDWDKKRTSNAVYRGLSDLRTRLAQAGVLPREATSG